MAEFVSSTGLTVQAGTESISVADVVAVAEAAGAAILDIYNSETENWDVKAKCDSSPLTAADLAANTVICEALRTRYPSIPIVSEENKMLPYDERKGYDYFWCVDPLDGTKEFIKRNGQFTVNIGLCRGHSPVFGVVYVPASSPPRTYFGVKGSGAFLRVEGEESPRQIHAKEFRESDPGLTIVASASHNTPATDAFIAKFQDPKKKELGSSLKLLLVAEGEAHVYPRLAPTCEWDTCAAQAVVEAAGGEVLQVQGGKEAEDGKPVVYNKPDPLNPFFVVYGKRIT